METIAGYLVAAAALMWGGILALPWRPWGRAPVLDADRDASSPGQDLSDITVLIPARNEAACIQKTLRSLVAQGHGLTIVLVDDQSSDETARLARETNVPDLIVLSGEPLPPGWSGKLWALEQGRREVRSRLTLLMDADIELSPGMAPTLRDWMGKKNLQLVSLMAVPPMHSFWEKLLMPAFVYFFKLLYPFHLSNAPSSGIAAAAGGCLLVETRLLDEIGGFASLREALIDDCALARRIKSRGYGTWIGLTQAVRSLRPYGGPREIGDMIARTAFTQLGYSPWWLGLCTLLMALGFGIPVIGLLHPSATPRSLAAVTLMVMMATYVPTLRFYGRSAAWALAMPLIGLFYLAMTWSSAIRYWRGERSRWKGRSYGRPAAF